MAPSPQSKLVWQPSQARIGSSNLSRFAQSLGKIHGSYDELHRWSIKHRENFWNAVWEFTGVIGSRGTQTLTNGDDFLKSEWFPEGRLNFVQNLLQLNEDKPAIVSYLEDGTRNTLSYRELRSKVINFSRALESVGVRANDRVAAYLPNVAETIVAMLATVRIGAIWSSCSPDFGVRGAVDRFEQIHPKVLIGCDGYRYNGKRFDVRRNVEDIRAHIPSIEKVFMLHLLTNTSDDFSDVSQHVISDLDYEWFPFNHPLYILFSSGTTGKPKCIVHGAGGTLLQHLKEHQLHTDIQAHSIVFFYTTCGWMMWNWLVSALASHATIVLYDGSPTYPDPDRLISMIDQEQISIFGAGAKYFSTLENLGVRTDHAGALSSLQTVLSTGSPLAPESFDYIYRDLKQDVQVESISGGTDIISCFALGVPWLPVYRGELQGFGLGMDVDVFNEKGESNLNQKGELVCKSTFPSKPVSFWDDCDHEKFEAAYFGKFSNVWAHGDFAEVNSTTGGMIIHGRSDAVLNPGGVRIGTAEIYRQVESMEEIEEAVCIGQEWNNDTRILLFVVVKDGVRFTSELVARIKQRIRENATPRHVPAKILPVHEIPKTRSGKIAELAVRDIVHGRIINNTSALANPECLKQFEHVPEFVSD